MSVKRPAILFLIPFILGIIIAYSEVPTLFKLLLLAIAIFLYAKLVYEEKVTFKVILVVLLFLILGFYRFKIETNIYDGYTKNVESLEKGNKILTGKIDSIGKSTNSNYYELKDVVANGLNLGNCRLYFNDEINPFAKIGQTIKVTAGTTTIDSPMNEGEFNQKNYYRSNGISFIAFAKDFEIVNEKYDLLQQKIYEIKILIKAQIQKIFEPRDAGLFSAMVTGDKSTIDKEQKKDFSDNGIAHILAISGLHLSILGLALFELLRKKFSIHFSAAVVSIFILLYGIFIDAGATSLRAICMLYIRFLSLAIGRTYDSKNTLYIICFIFLMLHPYLLFNAGFQFSYVAIFALNHEVYIAKKESVNAVDNVKSKYKIPAVIILTLFLFPITIYHYFTYPLYSFLLNLIVIPLMSFVLGFGLVGLGISFIFLPLGKIIVFVVHLIFLIYDYLIKIVEMLPAHILWLGKPTLYEVLYFYVALFLIFWALSYKDEPLIKLDIINKISKKVRVLICAVLLIMSVLILSIRTHSDMRMTFISIGQGDSILIESNDLICTIDGGSTSNTSNGQYVFTPHIKSRAISHIDYAFVTHPDADHTNGLIYLLNEEEEVKIRNLVLPTNAKTDENFDELKAAASSAGTKVLYVKEGDEYKLKEDFTIKILSPLDGAVKSKKMDANELSLTMRVDYKNHSALFTGDIGKTTMNRLIKDEYASKNMNAEILKVPHHGSKNSNVKKFYEMVNAKYAVISYGKNNTYGHPHKVTVDTIKDTGAKVLKTGELGQIDLYLDKANAYYDSYVMREKWY